MKLAALRHEFLEIVRIGDALEIAAVDCLGLVMLRHRYGLEALIAGGHKNIAAHEVHEIGALEQHLRDPGVVVVLR